ncbi:hypothetical protein [Methyloversatilis sp.]|uniref:hypothetical protein n=1 Tax=Methyloversatilis sp. TaxID=2569862 RepID=UPI0035B38D13
MKTLFIPPLGTELTLAEDWHFDLYYEHRNESLIEVMGINYKPTGWGDYGKKNWPVVLPAGTTLKVDRIYIRKGGSDFDSVTFFLKGEKTKKKVVDRTYTTFDNGVRTTGKYEYTIPSRGVRFWAKLRDVNKIVMKEE